MVRLGNLGQRQPYHKTRVCGVIYYQRVCFAEIGLEEAFHIVHRRDIFNDAELPKRSSGQINPLPESENSYREYGGRYKNNRYAKKNIFSPDDVHVC